MPPTSPNNLTSHRPSRRGVYAECVMREVEDLIREQRKRFDHEFNRIGCLVLVAQVLFLVTLIGAVLVTSNVWDILRSGR